MSDEAFPGGSDPEQEPRPDQPDGTEIGSAGLGGINSGPPTPESADQDRGIEPGGPQEHEDDEAHTSDAEAPDQYTWPDEHSNHGIIWRVETEPPTEDSIALYGLLGEDDPHRFLGTVSEAARATGEKLADIGWFAVGIITSDSPQCQMGDYHDPETGELLEDAVKYESSEGNISIVLGPASEEEMEQPSLGEAYLPPTGDQHLAHGDRMWVDILLPSRAPLEITRLRAIYQRSGLRTYLMDFKTDRLYGEPTTLNLTDTVESFEYATAAHASEVLLNEANAIAEFDDPQQDE